VVVIPFAEDSYDNLSDTEYYSIVNYKQFYGFVSKGTKNYKSYEQALESGLLEGLKLIK
jgi:hypothetical protein